MIKRILALSLAILLIGNVAYAATPAPANENIIYQYGKGQTRGASACTVIVPVRYALEGNSTAGVTSGDVMIWSTTSADGYTVNLCETDNDSTYAGVLVTDIQTNDVAGVFDIHGRNWGWMAVHGYVLAKTDTTGLTVGEAVVPNGATLSGSFRTITSDTSTVMSCDLGVLLAQGATDAAMAVWLR